jgi:hypothetical protein
MNDLEKIRVFLAHLYAWLAASYGVPAGESPWPLISVRSELQDVAAAAWRDYQRGYPLGALQLHVLELSPDTLRRHGLYGAQLTYKLATIDFAASQAFKGLSGWLRKLLELIDNLLESILKALGVDDALKEIKDSLLVSLPDDE